MGSQFATGDRRHKNMESHRVMKYQVQLHVIMLSQREDHRYENQLNVTIEQPCIQLNSTEGLSHQMVLSA